MIPLKDNRPLLKFPFWTISIILLNIYVFYLEITLPNTDKFILKYTLIPNQINPSNITSLAPFVTSQFLHAGFIHIISNMLFLWVFGNNIEAALGFLVFPIFYISAGIVAGLTQYVIAPAATIPMLGASGAIAGILGAYLALFPYHKIKTLIFIFFFVTIIDIRAYLLLVYWFISQFFSGVATISTNPNVGGIAFLPHVGGFLFGWLTTYLVLSKRSFLRLKLA